MYESLADVNSDAHEPGFLRQGSHLVESESLDVEIHRQVLSMKARRVNLSPYCGIMFGAAINTMVGINYYRLSCQFSHFISSRQEPLEILRVRAYFSATPAGNLGPGEVF